MFILALIAAYWLALDADHSDRCIQRFGTTQLGCTAYRAAPSMDGQSPPVSAGILGPFLLLEADPLRAQRDAEERRLRLLWSQD